MKKIRAIAKILRRGIRRNSAKRAGGDDQIVQTVVLEVQFLLEDVRAGRDEKISILIECHTECLVGLE